MDDRKRLQEIMALGLELAGYLDGVDTAGFEEDRQLQRAVERVLTIIGESSKRLQEETRTAIPQPWREIIRFRDKGIHAYDTLSPATIYRIATESVPGLMRAVAAHSATIR